MPSRSDAIKAIMTLKELADAEQEFLTRAAEAPHTVPVYELQAHAAVIKTLIGAQTTILYMVMNQIVDTDDKLTEILDQLEG